MAGPIGVGDVIAVIKVCQGLVTFIRQTRQASVDFQNSVVTLQSLHTMFSTLSETLQYSSINVHVPEHEREFACDSLLQSFIVQCRRALERARQILLDRYAQPGNAAYGRQARSIWQKLRWHSTREAFEKEIMIVEQNLLHICVLISARNR